MAPVIAPSEGERGILGRPAAATGARRTTTLYDLLAALQAVAGPDNDAFVVVTVVHLQQSGRLTFTRQARTGRRMRPWEYR